MKKLNYLIDKAIEYSSLKTNKEKSLHCCIVFNSKNKILSIKYNFKDSHAEETAIKNLKGGNNLLVIRIDSSNNILYSKPCKDCIEKIKKTNIKNIYYSVSFNMIEKIKTYYIENNHRSYYRSQFI